LSIRHKNKIPLPAKAGLLPLRKGRNTKNVLNIQIHLNFRDKLIVADKNSLTIGKIAGKIGEIWNKNCIKIGQK